MKRLLASVVLLTVLGVAAAQPPVDHELLCIDVATSEHVTIGVASVSAGQVRVAILDGATCADVEVVGATDLAVELERDADGALTVTVFLGGEELTEGVRVTEVPLAAIDGMLGAQRHRSAAMEQRAFGQARAEERGGPAPEGSGEGPGPGRPDELPEPAGSGEGPGPGRPDELPEPAREQRRP